MKNRYYYYIIAGTMTVNIVAFVPRILISTRMDGMVVAILIGSFIGMGLIYSYTTLMGKFPGKSYADILYEYTPKWFAVFFTLFTATAWFTSGFIFLMGFTFIAKRFINPETPLTLIVLLFLLPLLYGCVIDSKRLLYATEIMLVLIFPILIIIFIKAYTSDNLHWTTMKIPIVNAGHVPAYFAIAAAGYPYDGVMNLAQFNKVFTEKIKIKRGTYIVMGMIGILNLVTSSFIPIGINGIDGVGSMNYPWILTSDSFRIEFGFFERIFFPFLLLFMAVAILVILHHWHVSYKFFNYALKFPKFTYKGKEVVPYFILTAFLAITLLGVQRIEEIFLFILEKWWFVIVQPLVICHATVLYFIYRRAKKCGSLS